MSSTTASKLGHRRPANVGKSTLINTLLGEERVIAFDMPGTTRDAIEIDFGRDGRKYTLIDTAGLRKRGKVFEAIEKFSVIKTLQAIEASNVVLLMIDARGRGVRTGCPHRRLRARETGRVVVGGHQQVGRPGQRPARSASSGSSSASCAFSALRACTISALKGRGVKPLLKSVNAAHAASFLNCPRPG